MGTGVYPYGFYPGFNGVSWGGGWGLAAAVIVILIIIIIAIAIWAII